MGRVGLSVLGDEGVEEDTSAERRLLGQGDLALCGGDRAVRVAGEREGDSLNGGGARGEHGVVAVTGEALMGLGAAAEQEEEHDEDASDKCPEENTLVTGDHGCAPGAGFVAGGGLGGATWAFQAMTDCVTASAMRCW